MNIKKFLSKREIFRFILAISIPSLVIVATASGSTTLSTNILTGGTLTVTGLGHFQDDLNIYGADINLGTGSATTTLTSAGGSLNIGGTRINLGTGTATTTLTTVSATLTSISSDLDLYGADLNIGTGSATTTLTSAAGALGVASTSPWGLFSVEALQGTVGTNVPTFVVGDKGTSTPLLLVSGVNGNVGIGTSTPYVVLGVTGTTTSTAGVTIGSGGSGVTQLLFGTCSVDFGAITASTTAVATCAATGVSLADKVFVTPASVPNEIIFTGASSTAADTIQVSAFYVGATAASLDPAAATWSWIGIR